MAKFPTILPEPDDDEEEQEDQTAYWAQDISENAFNCLKGEWPTINKDGLPTKCVENAIAALRWFLDERKIQLKWDLWRRYNAIHPSSTIDNDPTIDWLNEVGKEHKLFFSETMFKDAMKRLGYHNKFHSRLTYYYRDLPQWDQIPRIETFVKDCLKAEGTKLELCVIQMHLIASVRKVRMPGVAYDMCVCLISPQGYMKSKMLSILYGEDNVLAEDISCKDTKTQSERTRQGVNCVELPETLGDPKSSVRVRIDKVKAFITGRDYKGVREAYGRVENMRPMRRTFVIWHTRNTEQFLEDPTGNRRFLPMPIRDYIDEDWLRLNKDQLWAEVVELEERGRHAYEDDNANKGIVIPKGDEKYTDIFLPTEFWEESEELGKRHMVEVVELVSYEKQLEDLINQPFVHRESEKTFVLLDDLKPYLHISDKKWIGKSKEITAILKKLGWNKEQIWWNRDNKNGYVLMEEQA